MTQTPELPKTREEWHALAVRWPRLPEEVQEQLESSMTRAQRKQLESTVERIHEPEKRRYAGKITTREDVIGILALYNDRKIMPFAARLDQAERHIELLERTIGYMALPWYKRLWTHVAKAWLLFIAWLDTKGIRFTKTTEEQDEADADGDAPGEEAGRLEDGDREVPGEAPADRVRDDRGAGVGAGRGRQTSPSGIEIVRR